MKYFNSFCDLYITLQEIGATAFQNKFQDGLSTIHNHLFAIEECFVPGVSRMCRASSYVFFTKMNEVIGVGVRFYIK